MITRIHINQQRIKANKKLKKPLPVITVKTYKNNRYGFEAEITGPCKVVYRPDQPLNCGGVCWVETKSKVIVKRRTTPKKRVKHVPYLICPICEETGRCPYHGVSGDMP